MGGCRGGGGAHSGVPTGGVLSLHGPAAMHRAESKHAGITI